MTMDNGEGRPLDEAESGQDDPQGWYFDLPGGAWERQEEKNRTLRQRVLGNIQEDAEKAKGDPFGKKFELKPQPEAAFELKRPEPEAKKGRGLFGFAKKQKQSGGAAEIPATRRYDSASPVEHDEDEEWSTEPSLKLSPFPRAESHGAEASWGEPDGGWNLAAPATPAGDDTHEAPLETAEEDFATTMRPWAHQADHEDESQDSVAPFSAIESIEAESHDGQLAEIEEEDFATRIPSWAHRDESAKDESTGDDLGAPAWEPAETEADTAPDRETPAFAPVARVEGWDEGEALRSGPASEEEREPANAATVWDLQNDAVEAEAPDFSFDEEPELPQPLVLRPRAQADGEKRLDWNFGPAAWGDSPAGPGEPAAAAYEADIEDSALSSMKKWAQRGREDGHPHFTTVHHETEEIDDDIAPAPIPLRPRHQEDEPHTIARESAVTETNVDPGALPTIPLVLRSRTEPPAEAPVRDASSGPSKWDDFFNIAPEGEADGETSEASPTGEGIAAMRAWAQKRAEPEAPEKIPDEFLKPFDWELQEDEPEASSAAAVPAEFLKPFDREAGESASETDEASPSEAWEEADAEALAPETEPLRGVFEADEPADSTFAFPSEAVHAPQAAGDPFGDDDDPLAGLFEHARAAAPAPAGKKKGRLGRLFGRGKREDAEQPALLDTDEPGDWILPSEDAEDADVRVVAEKDWDEHGGTFAAPDAQPATSAGWGASRSEGWLSSDSDALSEFATNISASESPAGPEAADPEIAAAGLADEVTTWATAGLAAAEAEDADQADAEFAWGSGATAPAPGVGPDPASAWSAGVIEDLPDDQDTWSPEPVNETPYFARLTASTADWEAAEVAPDGLDSAAHDADAWDPVEPEIPVEAVASVDAVAEEPVAEKPWWEQPAVEEVVRTPVEAVASVDAVAEESVTDKAWWEQPAVEEVPEVSVEAVTSVDAIAEEPAAEKPAPEAPVEAVASVDAVVEKPVTEKAWWEQPAVEEVPEVSVEAVTSVDAVVEEPVADKPWWEQPAVEEVVETPVEAVASVDAVAEESVTDKAWWEQPAVEEVPEAPVEAVASVDAVVEEPVADKAWWEQPAAEEVPEASVEAVASVDAVVEEPVAEKAWWDQPAVEEVVETPVEAVASVDAVAEEPVADKPWWERPAADDVAETPVEAFASVDAVVEEPVADKAWWEQPAVEEVPEASVEAVASVDAVVEEPVADKPWWDQPAVEEVPETSVEAVASVASVASVDAVVEEPVAEKPWWEQPAEDEVAETPLEAVATVDAVVEEPVADKPWSERPAADDVAEAPVEAVASVDAVVEEPVAEKPWWEQPAGEESPEAPVEAVASVDAVVEEPVADKPWWDQPAVEEAPETPVEAVASVDAVVEVPAAGNPWWEQPAAEEAPEAPVEAVASVDAVAEEPAAEKPWWEQPAVEEVVETPVEAVASVDAVAEEPVAEKPWWEQPVVEQVPETPVEAVASVDAVVEEPVAEKPWWEQPAVEEVPEAPVEAVASVDAVVEEPVAKATSAFDTGDDDDDPWADFVSAPGPSEPTSPTPPPPTLNAGWSTPEPAAARDEDMWAHIAASAEEAARADEEEIDLAASLENQMAAARSQTSEWGTQVDDIEQWEAAPVAPRPSQFVAEEEEDVILAAFERHAATPDQPAAPRESDAVFAELLGDEAADIVAEALDDDAGRQSFIRMSAWAPQRSSQSFDGGWGPQQEVEETLGSAAHVPTFGGSDGAGFAPPSWAMDELEAEEAPAPRGHHKTKTWIREIVETSLLALLVFLSVRASFQNFKVEGSSMNPTLEDGQFLIVNKLVYSEVDMEKLSSFIPFVDAGSDPKKNVFHGPERGDIVVLIDPRDTNTDLIKRVIGLPGETIEIVDGKVYINDLLLEEPYITATWHDTKPKVVIPPGEYFVMGDNRENSLDSRSSQVGLVPKDLIIGKAMVSYWPSSKFGFAPNEEGKLTEAKPVLTTQRVDDD